MECILTWTSTSIRREAERGDVASAAMARQWVGGALHMMKEPMGSDEVCLELFLDCWKAGLVSSDWVVSEFGDLVLVQLPRMWMEYMHGYLASTAVRRARNHERCDG